MKKIAYAILLAFLCTTLCGSGSMAAHASEKVILKQKAIDIEEDIGGDYSFGAQILDRKGNIISRLKSMDLLSGITLTFTNLTDEAQEVKFLMLSNGQPQKFKIADGKDTYEYSYEIPAKSTVYFPLSCEPENGYPARNAEFLFILKMDKTPMDEEDDVCFYAFCHPFTIEDNINEELKFAVEPAARELTAEELDESSGSFYSTALFVTEQGTSNDKLKYQICDESCRIIAKSSGPAGVYSRLFFINNCLVFQKGRPCELFSLEENQVFEREYDLEYLFADTTVYFVTVDIGVEGWVSNDTSKIRILQ